MSVREPPRFATALLNRLLHDNEALAGDLLERLANGHSRGWFWRQVFLAVVLRAFQQCGHVLRAGVSLSVSALPDLAGFALFSACVLVTLSKPDAWWIFVPAVLGGIAFGVALAIVRRHTVHTQHPDAGRTIPRL